jgi:hypothetical protein
MISQALAKVNGQITKAAKLFGIRYQTLAFIIKQDTLTYSNNARRYIDDREGKIPRK